MDDGISFTDQQLLLLLIITIIINIVLLYLELTNKKQSQNVARTARLFPAYYFKLIDNFRTIYKHVLQIFTSSYKKTSWCFSTSWSRASEFPNKRDLLPKIPVKLPWPEWNILKLQFPSSKFGANAENYVAVGIHSLSAVQN